MREGAGSVMMTRVACNASHLKRRLKAGRAEHTSGAQGPGILIKVLHRQVVAFGRARVTTITGYVQYDAGARVDGF